MITFLGTDRRAVRDTVCSVRASACSLGVAACSLRAAARCVGAAVCSARVCLAIGVWLAIGPGASTSAVAAPGPIGRWRPSEGYAADPTVAKVRSAGYLSVLTRERALSSRATLDRSLAIVDAVGAEGVTKYGVDRALTRALRARKSLGPSGALLNKDIAVTTLDGRQALVLGWARALSARSAKALEQRGATIKTAGPLQLLELAARRSADAQAPRLALAVARAAVAPRRGRKACAAYIAVQKAARDPRNGAVLLETAERAVRAVAKLRRRCKRKQLAAFRRPISLPAPTAPPAAPSRPNRRPAQRDSADVYRKGIAFTVAAPLFKGYLKVPLIPRLIRSKRLDEPALQALWNGDKVGDATLAALNATLWSRRLPPSMIPEVVFKVVLSRHKLLGAPKPRIEALRISQLSPTEAVVLGYARALAGWGLERTELPGDPPALKALPRQLFGRARGQLPMSSALGRVVGQLHAIDLERQADLCRAAKRAEGVGFVVGKSALPKAAARVILDATDTVHAQCRSLGGPAPAAVGAGR